MKRNERRIATGILLATMAVSLADFASAADSTRATTPVRAESGLPAEVPLLGRIVITPSPKQLAQLRRDRRIARRDGPTAAGRRANIENTEAERPL